MNTALYAFVAVMAQAPTTGVTSVLRSISSSSLAGPRQFDSLIKLTVQAMPGDSRVASRFVQIGQIGMRQTCSREPHG